MNTARQSVRVSVEDYLRTELESTQKHEYIGGVLYAMSGGRNVHSTISSNLTSSLWNRLPEGPCQAMNSDVRIRIRLPGHTRFYYPDASVVCRPNPQDQLYQDQPALIAEVLSDSSRRTDLHEKKEAYLSIPSLDLYLLVEPEAPEVIVYRRTDAGFAREQWEGLHAVVPMPELGIVLPLNEVYRRVSFEANSD